MEKYINLSINLDMCQRAPKKRSLSVRKSYIRDLKIYYPDVVSYILHSASAGAVKILFTDLDGTVTTIPGSHMKSAFMLVTPRSFFEPERDVDISEEHPLFRGKFKTVRDFYTSLVNNNVMVIPVTRNYSNITIKIMKLATGCYCPGWYGSSIPTTSRLLHSKSEFMEAVLYYLQEEMLQYRLLFIDDDSSEIFEVAKNVNINTEIVPFRVSPWIGENGKLREHINLYFGL